MGYHKMKTIHNLETGEIIERELNEDELKQQEIDQINFEAQQEIRLAETKSKAAAKSALLAKLGITADEAKLLLS